MVDGFLNCHPPLHSSASLLKRPRSDFEVIPSGLPSHKLHKYIGRDDNLAGPWIVKDKKSLGSAYEHYLQNQFSSISSLEASSCGGPVLERTVGSCGSVWCCCRGHCSKWSGHMIWTASSRWHYQAKSRNITSSSRCFQYPVC